MRAAAVIIAVGLAGCAPLWDYSPRTPSEDEADYLRTRTNYRELAAVRVKELKYAGGLEAPAISPLRKSHSVAFADWMACVKGDGNGRRQVFAVFYRDRKIADFRHAVVIDGCDAEPFAPLGPDTLPGRDAQASTKPELK